MDGLGGVAGRSMNSMVLRFDLSVCTNQLSTSSPVYPPLQSPPSSSSAYVSGDIAVVTTARDGNSNVFSVQTKPCATNRHLFWDEQVSLIVPGHAMTEHGSSASTIKISMVGAPAEAGAVFAVTQKPLYNFIQHVVESNDGILQPKQNRYDAVVSMAICDSSGAGGTSSSSSSSTNSPAPVSVARSSSPIVLPALRVRLGIMLFTKKPGDAEQSEDMVERFEKSKKCTCKLSSITNLVVLSLLKLILVRTTEVIIIL